MVIGRVDWFGGLNKQTQKINNYGFIVPLEGKDAQGIYVHRDDVPVHLQNALEPGTYIEFDIQTHTGKEKAVNVELVTAVGIVDWFYQGRGYINCEERSDVRLISSDYFYAGIILYFGIRYNPKLGKDEAVLVQRVSDATIKQDIVEQCAKSKNSAIFKKFIFKYANSLPVEEAISFIIEKLNLLSPGDKQSLINELSSKADHLLLKSPELRSLLSANEYGLYNYTCFINRHLDSTDEILRQELLGELIQKVNESSTSVRSVYWNKIKYLQQNLEYKGFLWDIAPSNVKSKLIQDKYKKFFNIISQFQNSEYPCAKALSTSCEELYAFVEVDKKLIRQWAYDIEQNSFKAAQMISARGAEKLVIKFYEALGYTVEDISAHQVTHESNDWKRGDVRLDSSSLLDVKNARNSVNSDTYSEFCVPAFKTTRGNDVKIVAVLSPYLQKEFMDGTKKINFYASSPNVLGEFDKSELENLEKLFSAHLITIDISRSFEPKTYLPHWLFDYDERFYAKQLEVVEQFRQLQDADIPSWEDISTLGQNPLPLFITAQRKLPQEWFNSLPLWKAKFIDSLVTLKVERISLPYVFLSLLRHFLNMLSQADSDYSPKKYQEILYTGFDSVHPLKLYDPLNTIKDFCDTLQILWEHREKSNLNKFKFFKFNGRGLLQGKRSETENVMTTILAYCGGWVEKKGKCGHIPLVIGKHETCLSCGRLICPNENCRYCSDNCLSYFKRK